MLLSVSQSSLVVGTQDCVAICRLFDKHKQFEQSQQDVARLQEHIDHLNKTMDDLQQVIGDKDAEINKSVPFLTGVATITILTIFAAILHYLRVLIPVTVRTISPTHHAASQMR